MGQARVLLSWILLLQGIGAASANSPVIGSLGGSVFFNVTLPIQLYGLISWNLEKAPAVHLIPGLPPTYFGQFDGRCEMFENGSLMLNNINYNDEGRYTLVAYDVRAQIVHMERYDLKVYALLTPPVLRFINTNNPVISGSFVTLECDAGNHNGTNYTFYRDDYLICSEQNTLCSGSLLVFVPISIYDEGSYTCTVQNLISNSTSNSLNVTVFVAVSYTGVMTNTSEPVWPGIDSVSLTCLAVGTDVSYSWSLEGAPITGGNRFSLANDNSTLIISPVSSNDTGSFVCTASNIINNQSSSTKLDLASPVSDVVLTSNTSGALWAGQDSVSLYCSAQGSTITFSWKFNGNPVSSNSSYHITQSDSPSKSTLTISPVSKNDTGPFTCAASNKENSMTSNEVNLTINWSPDENILCTAQPTTSGVLLGCSWTGGNPAANVTMILNDVQNTSTDQVFRDVTSSGNIQGNNLTCNGDQLGRTTSCVLLLENPESPGFVNDSIRSVAEGDLVVLTVNLMSSSHSSQVLPAKFSWSREGGSDLPGDRVTVNNTDYTSTLKIDNVSAGESGTYQCKAINVIGSTTYLFNVDVSKEVVPSTGLSGGAIAGIVIGVLVGVTLIGIAVFFILKRRKSTGNPTGVVYEHADAI